MSHMARNNPPPTDLDARGEDDGSTVRTREGEAASARRESSSGLKASASPKRAHSSTRPAAGSLDDRLARKMQRAGELMEGLPPTDARVRLLYVAIMRRDEALLDGLLSELNKAPPSR